MAKPDPIPAALERLTERGSAMLDAAAAYVARTTAAAIDGIAADQAGRERLLHAGPDAEAAIRRARARGLLAPTTRSRI